jgi:hypothetical protein
MNAGDFGILVLLAISLVAITVGAIVFGAVGLVIGVRRMLKAWW